VRQRTLGEWSPALVVVASLGSPDGIEGWPSIAGSGPCRSGRRTPPPDFNHEPLRSALNDIFVIGAKAEPAVSVHPARQDRGSGRFATMGVLEFHARAS
jgi:hypothetical protein